MELRQNGLVCKGPALSSRRVASTPAVVSAITANDYAALSKAVEDEKGALPATDGGDLRHGAPKL